MIANMRSPTRHTSMDNAYRSAKTTNAAIAISPLAGSMEHTSARMTATGVLLTSFIYPILLLIIRNVNNASTNRIAGFTYISFFP